MKQKNVRKSNFYLHEEQKPSHSPFLICDPTIQIEKDAHIDSEANYSYVEKRLIYSVVLHEFTRHISVVDDCGRSTNPKNCLYLCINLLYEFGATFLFRFSVIHLVFRLCDLSISNFACRRHASRLRGGEQQQEVGVLTTRTDRERNSTAVSFTLKKLGKKKLIRSIYFAHFVDNLRCFFTNKRLFFKEPRVAIQSAGHRSAHHCLKAK